MNYREKMKEYLKEPDEYSSQYGKWGILNKEQRDLIKRLLREMDNADEVIKNQFFELEKLKDKYEQREKKWEKWTTEKTILSTRMSDYLCKYQNIKREYTKQIKISTDRKKEIERLNNIIKHVEGICESSIVSVNQILQDEKETKIVNGRCINRNEYQIVRLKAYRTKSKEILGRIKELKGDSSNGN